MSTQSDSIFNGANGQSSGQLIQLSGVNFRGVEINCAHCDWQGTAGQLRVPNPSALEKAVEYACPGCATIIASHPGLSTDEVMKEMLRIRQLLSEEMSETMYQADSSEGRADRSADFMKVRAQLRNAELRDTADGGQPVTALSGTADKLDFEEIRSRLSGIT